MASILRLIFKLIANLIRLFKRNKTAKSSLIDDIAKANEWVAGALSQSGYNSDGTIESLRDIDRFFDEQSGEDGIINQNRGRIIFGIAAYLGEVAIKEIGGEWETGTDSEVDISVKLADGSTIFPVHKVMSRYKNGAEDSLYQYIYILKNK